MSREVLAIIFENEPKSIERISKQIQALEDEGYSVEIQIVGTIDHARTVIDQIAKGELNPLFVLVDGELYGAKPEKGYNTHGVEIGTKIEKINKTRDRAERITTIGFATYTHSLLNSEGGSAVDHLTAKRDQEEIMKIIRKRLIE